MGTGLFDKEVHGTSPPLTDSCSFFLLDTCSTPIHGTKSTGLPPASWVSYVCLFNPLSADMKMHILLTILQTFLMELVRRVCLNIKTSYPR